MRPTALLATARWEKIFPPPSPTKARELKGEPFHALEFVDMVATLLDAQTDPRAITEDHDFIAALKTSDGAYFARLVKAARYIKQMPHNDSVFAQHVIWARKIAAQMMKRDGRLPTKERVKTAIIKRLVNVSYDPELLTRWSEVWAAADLADLPDGSNTRKSTPHKAGGKK